MRIAITGAGGFIGRALTRAALLQGLKVRGLVRDQTGVFSREVEVACCGDLSRASNLPELFDDCACVVNLAARTHVIRETAGAPQEAFMTENADLAVIVADAAARAGVGRFIQMSSVAAVCSVTRSGVIIDDTADAAPGGLYGCSKLAADVRLAKLTHETGMTIASLRPPAVFGPGVGAYFRQLMRCAKAGLPLPFGQVANRRSFIYVENLADAVLCALSSDIRGNFIVTDSDPISTADLYRRLLRLYGRPNVVLSVAPALARSAARLILGDRVDSLLGNSAFDGTYFKDKFNWSPPIDFDEALTRTVRGGA